MDKKINRSICPICGSPVNKTKNIFFPFCCKRCKEADLHNWLTGRYKISSPLKNDDKDEETVRKELP